mgnify:FL=1
MSSSSTILSLMERMLLAGILGYGAGHLGFAGVRLKKRMTALLLNLILPLGILGTSNTTLEPGLYSGMALTVLFATLYYIFSICILRWLASWTRLSDGKRKIWVMTGVFANSAFIGLPLVLGLYGNEGLLYGVIHGAVYNVFMFTFGVRFLGGQEQGDWVGCIGNPTMIASLILVVFLASPLKLPEGVSGFCQLAGKLIMPFSMVIIGCSLGEINIGTIWTKKEIWSVSFLRLWIFPVLSIILLKIAGLKDTASTVFVVLTALPAGTLNVIMAERYGGDSAFASEAVLQSTCLMLFTLPGVLWMVDIIL